MRLIYKMTNSDNFIAFDIDRVHKSLEVNSTKTGGKWVKRPWRELFDAGKEAEQEERTDGYSDIDFLIEITSSMNKLGYALLPERWLIEEEKNG